MDKFDLKHFITEGKLLSEDREEEEKLPRGWNDKLEAVYRDQMDDYLSSYSNYYPTREAVLKNAKEEFNKLKNTLGEDKSLSEDREAEEMAAGMPPRPGSKRDKEVEMRSETFSITSEYEGKMERLSYDQIESTLESALEIANNVEDFVEKVTYGLTDETSVLSLEDQDKLKIWYNSKVPKTQDFDGEVGDDLKSDLSDIDKLKDEYELLYSERYPSGARRAGFKHRSTTGNDRYGDLYFHSDFPREFRHEDEYDNMSDDKQDILSQVEEFEFEVDKLFDKYGVPQNSHAG